MSDCALHHGVPSLVTCKRCGRFCCRECLPQRETCWACLVWNSRQIPPPAFKLPFVLHAARVPFALLAVVLALAGAPSWALLSVTAAAILDLVATVPFHGWLQNVAAHAAVRGAGLEGDTPSELARKWFIPWGAWTAGFQAVELFAVARQRGLLVRGWPALWLVGALGDALLLTAWRDGITVAGLYFIAGSSLVSALVSAVNLRALRFPALEVPPALRFPAAP